MVWYQLLFKRFFCTKEYSRYLALLFSPNTKDLFFRRTKTHRPIFSCFCIHSVRFHTQKIYTSIAILSTLFIRFVISERHFCPCIYLERERDLWCWPNRSKFPVGGRSRDSYPFLSIVPQDAFNIAEPLYESNLFRKRIFLDAQSYGCFENSYK